ncbi:MAG: hypothetical protein Ct9H300mP15_06410 [Gemmatimonadota bacterium]|nr:MAG: hypothetical protein Ct9H300mP15_06410 [Gemmatimonadota bacterium]
MVTTRPRARAGRVSDCRWAKVLAGGDGHYDNLSFPNPYWEMSLTKWNRQRRTFGPVACVTRVSSVDEAVTKANDTHFGLGAVVFWGRLEEPQKLRDVSRQE